MNLENIKKSKATPDIQWQKSMLLWSNQLEPELTRLSTSDQRLTKRQIDEIFGALGTLMGIQVVGHQRYH